MRTTWDFASSECLTFGWGASVLLDSRLARFDRRRVMVITDKRLVSAGLVHHVTANISSKRAVEIFDGGEPEPSMEVAEAAIKQAEKFEPDCFVAIGGGSNMDVAKLTALLYTHGGPPQQYIGFDKVPGPVAFLICIPTTAGTGSEVSHAAVLGDPVSGIKSGVLSPLLRPAIALVDPELTLGCPAKVTADSGIDALTHAIETYLATNFDALSAKPDELVPFQGKNPLADLLAERAIGLIAANLRTAVKEPGNRSAREAMALAATIAGLAFSNGAVAAVHALEYPLGALYHCSHGAGNGLMLPHVMRHNLPARMGELARIATMMDVNTEKMSIEEAASAAIDAVTSIRDDIGVPRTLRDLNAKRDDIPAIAEKAFTIKRLMGTTPVAPTTENLQKMLEAAW
jgi:alcohol dehydrogenase class IV